MSCRLLLILLLPAALAAQTPYFQQEVHYTIRAALNDRDHTLDAFIRMEYVNHAPDSLPEIWMHLWPNAYKNRNTAFCRQKLREGSTRFYFAPDSTLGFFQNLDFRVDGQPVTWHYDPANPDIAVLTLDKPLPPGGRIAIETPFLLKIPASFSRLGHVRTSYQMTQWYPKPAVYDTRGWHVMPYLDMGEFFSEFGSFDVQITLPDNYVVGATGTLLTDSEQVFLQKKEAETHAEMVRRDKLLSAEEKAEARKAPFPPSSETTKTLHFTAENVHDFAWFADKRFFVLRDTARLPSGRTVDCWAMFPAEQFDLWRKGAFYVRRAVEFYSRNVGEYPWPHATAVHSALSAGGGMEYPMITVIGDSGNSKSLDEVITHEVGHNWFYGILATNERDHPWLDEGLNSYYEARYMQQYYGSDMMVNFLPRWAFDPVASGSAQENACVLLARDGADTPPDTHSDDFWAVAYGIQAYMKPALCLAWLEQSLGRLHFDQAMQAYFQKWKLRHPYPEDLRDAWREAGVEADWFFEAMQTRRRFDPALTKVRRTDAGFDLTVKNRGTLDAPFSISAMRGGRAMYTRWYPAPGAKKTTVQFPDVDTDLFVLDSDRATLDVNRHNNNRRPSGLFPGVEPVNLRLLALAERPGRTELGVLPWLGWNNADKTMAGVLLHNAPFPPRRFQYFLFPGYGIGSRNFVGLADVRYRFLPGGWLPKLTAGISARTATYSTDPTHNYDLQFYRLTPSVRAEFRSPSPAFEHALTLRTLFLGKEEAQFSEVEGFIGKKTQRATIHEARYEGRQRGLPNPYSYSAALEWQDYPAPDGRPAHYLRGALEWKQQFYYKPGRKVSARVFAGYFLANTQRRRGNVATNNLSGDVARAAFALNPQGFNDYRFDQVFLGRSEVDGFFSRQVSQTEGGFKNAFGAPFAQVLGNSNNFIAALNLRADLPSRLPLGLPIKPYFDIGYFDDATPLGAARPSSEQLLWSGGFLVEILNGSVEVYFPLVNAKPLRDRYAEVAGNNYFRRISWSIRLGRVGPLDVVRQLGAD
ncbi:MAG: M1 family metallopeptidase [Lewinellaceae bacterium]|nr:M1 family metallopeptidase [Lewinellaceae bacterium]